MKYLAYIIVFIGLALGIYVYLQRPARSQAKGTGLPTGTDPVSLPWDQQVALVINIIKDTPAWYAHVIQLAEQGTERCEWKCTAWPPGCGDVCTGEPPMPLQRRLVMEAEHHLRKRGIENIINNPENFINV